MEDDRRQLDELLREELTDMTEPEIIQARENIRTIMNEIEEVKPREVNLDPFKNQIQFGEDTVFKWKLKPKVFKILSRLILGGDWEEAILQTPFKLHFEHHIDNMTSVWADVNGRIGYFTDPQDDRDFNFQFGATLRF